MKVPRHILPVIVLSQFLCTSLWFAGNGVMSELMDSFGLSDTALVNLTSAVQLGFIAGTLIFAILNIADRFSPSRVFLVCALTGALINLLMSLSFNNFFSLMGWRFLTGFFLAGIYPVGMKIAADYFDKDLGKSLGYLVGALVLGTALPHFIKYLNVGYSWLSVVYGTSLLAATGGLLMFLFVRDGPFRKPGKKPDFSAIHKVFQSREFRSAAFGYFGHMWELYAFWTFVPVILSLYSRNHGVSGIDISLGSFLVIASGSLSCVIGGYYSLKYGSRKVAFSSLALSGLCCLLSPLFLQLGSPTLFIFFIFIWAFAVIADSPQFSTLVAYNAIPELKGTALTIVNCTGFALTIFSIQLLQFVEYIFPPEYIYLCLLPGPVLGLFALRRIQTL